MPKPTPCPCCTNIPTGIVYHPLAPSRDEAKAAAERRAAWTKRDKEDVAKVMTSKGYDFHGHRIDTQKDSK